MISGKILRDAIISGANNINNQRSRVDELNVFPVPDGDTGTNMGMTVGAGLMMTPQGKRMKRVLSKNGSHLARQVADCWMK